MQAGSAGRGNTLHTPVSPRLPTLSAPQTIDAFRADLASLREGLQAAVREVHAAVLDKMEALQAEWQPTLDRLDVA